ncbi:MAG TPA: ABC transporter substrate-binding protein [Reyranella sp.]|nr:ABC transporter substrate-binding protein [Reyranella sp.]
MPKRNYARRELLAAAALAPVLAAGAGAAQARTARVGWLAPGNSDPAWALFTDAMAKLGYVEGTTVTYDRRSAESDLGKIDALAAVMVAAKPDVIVAYFTPSIWAAKKATSAIPIVFVGGAVETGLVGSFAHPTGNLTGVLGGVITLSGKSVQLLQEINPALRHVVALCNKPDPFSVPFLAEIEKVGAAEHVEIEPVMIEHAGDLLAAFDRMERRRPDGIIVQPSLPQKEVAALALAHRLPATCSSRRFAELGGLFAYTAHQPELYRVVAKYVDRILKGSKPSDLPVQEASRFELVVNQKTARAIGLAIPPLFLARADQVIE